VQQTIDAADRDPLAVVETPGKPAHLPRAKSEHIAALEQQFRTALGMKVKISHNARAVASWWSSSAITTSSSG